MKKSKIFATITNQDIIDEIKSLQEKVEEWTRTNTTQHGQIISRQDKTNGKLKLNYWIASTAMGLTVILLGFLFNHMR